MITDPGSALYLFPHRGVCIYYQWYIHSHLGILAPGSAKNAYVGLFYKISLIDFAVTAKIEMIELLCVFFF